jgi:hypothetical protein
MALFWSDDNKNEDENFIGPDEVFTNSHTK